MILPRGKAHLLLLPVIAWGLLCLSGREILPDRAKVDPVLSAPDDQAVRAARRKIAEFPSRPESGVSLFFRLEADDPVFPERVRGLGGTARRVAPGIYAGTIPPDAARYLSNRPEVAYLEAARRAYPLLDAAAPEVSADIVQAGSPAWPPPFGAGIRGSGVYVGIVDTGLDDAHPDFRTGGAGSPTRAVHTYASSGLPPSQANPLSDQDGHGTHVTGIAAGNGFSSGGTYTGMAPASSLLVGKTSFFTTDIVAALSNFVSFAGNAPVAMNLSLGLPTGPHDGTSTFESAVDSIAEGPSGSRRLVAAAAGNERTDAEHFRRTLPAFGAVTAFLTLEDTSGATAEFWADGQDRYTVTATMGSSSVTAASGSSGSSGGRVSVSNRVSLPPNGATFISVFFLPPAPGQTASVRLTRTRNGGTGTIDGYVDWFEATFDTPDESGTITEPANARNVIAVGSYNTKPGGGAGPVGAISSFSSLGPTRDGRRKPDLAAPGSVLYSARSSQASFDPGKIVPGNDNYVILQGTSMAAPHVTGIAALVWESNPALTGAQMRERLKRTSDLPGGVPAPDDTWGNGKVNALRAVTESVAAITHPASPVPGAPLLLTSERSSGSFGNPLTGYAWVLTPPPGSGATLSGGSAPTASFTPDLPGDYRVDLAVSQSDPSGTPAGNATAVVHVNNFPVATGISGPSSTDNVTPVVFTGTGSDADNQALTFHWILLQKPSGSSPTLTPQGADNVTLVPDRSGTYEIGLRVGDGLDNSDLVAKTFRAGVTSTGGGGGSGGSCSVARTGDWENLPTAATNTLLLVVIPIGILILRSRHIIL